MALYSDDQQTYYQARGESLSTGGLTEVTLFFEDGSDGPLTDTVRDDVVAAVRAVLAAVPNTRVVASRTDSVRTVL